MSSLNSRLQTSFASIIFPILILSWTNSSHGLSIDRNSFYRCRTDEALLLDNSRRSFVSRGFISLSTTITASTLFGRKADARGLVTFPCNEQSLLNTYHFMRAGSSLLELEDIWSTNPLFLTNREAALSQQGEDEVRRACNLLKRTGTTPTIVRYSLAASSIDTANIVGEELKIGRDRLVPEFNYMDPRAIGAWDFSPKNVTEEAVWAMDADEAGPSGRGGRPPPNEDGTPSETLSDQVVRLTNLMSVLETLYSGDDILLIFPDGTGPALLSCLIGGIPLYRVHELNFLSGEIRQNVDYSSVNAIASVSPSPYYLEVLQRGRHELRQLRENPDIERNVKDLKFEEERVVAEAQKKERQEQEERQAKQIELERMQKLEDERRKQEERRIERQIQAEQRELERREMKESTTNNAADASIWGVVVGGIGLVASSLSRSDQTFSEENNVLLANSTQSTTDNADQPLLSNATMVDADSVGNDELAVRSSTYVKHEQPTSMVEQTEMRVIDDEETKAHTNQISLEDKYNDWGDAWLGTINEIMNDARSEQ